MSNVQLSLRPIFSVFFWQPSITADSVYYLGAAQFTHCWPMSSYWGGCGFSTLLKGTAAVVVEVGVSTFTVPAVSIQSQPSSCNHQIM